LRPLDSACILAQNSPTLKHGWQQRASEQSGINPIRWIKRVAVLECA
jgi:hypothetical protein